MSMVELQHISWMVPVAARTYWANANHGKNAQLTSSANVFVSWGMTLGAFEEACESKKL